MLKRDETYWNKKIDILKRDEAHWIDYIAEGRFDGLSEREALEVLSIVRDELHDLFAAGYYGTEEAHYVVA